MWQRLVPIGHRGQVVRPLVRVPVLDENYGKAKEELAEEDK
ncbi:MAG: hypothetical protein ACRDQ5_03215 [Sciscionella sp.]